MKRTIARIAALSSALAILTAPLSAEAQQPGKVYRIGVLEMTSPALNAPNLDAFRQGPRELGYVEGPSLVIEYRSADGRAERFPDLASELVRLKLLNSSSARSSPAQHANAAMPPRRSSTGPTALGKSSRRTTAAQTFVVF